MRVGCKHRQDIRINCEDHLRCIKFSNGSSRATDAASWRCTYEAYRFHTQLLQFLLTSCRKTFSCTLWNLISARSLDRNCIEFHVASQWANHYKPESLHCLCRPSCERESEICQTLSLSCVGLSFRAHRKPKWCKCAMERNQINLSKVCLLFYSSNHSNLTTLKATPSKFNSLTVLMLKWVPCFTIIVAF